MDVEILKTLFSRDLNRLIKEIKSYQTEENLWIVSDGISNSGGNLCLHLIGNLKHFIGHILGKTDYVRQREHEFSGKNIPKIELITGINETISIINRVFENLKPTDLEIEYPILVFKEKTTTGYFLTHLATHLAYHLGQVNYHRRLLDRN